MRLFFRRIPPSRFPGPTSQNTMLPSRQPAASTFPVGENATDQTPSLWPANVDLISGESDLSILSTRNVTRLGETGSLHPGNERSATASPLVTYFGTSTRP